MKFIALLPVFILVMVSGCVMPFNTDPFQSETPSGTGVIIEAFAPDFQTVYSGEDVTFRLKVKNTGSITAERGFAELLGIDQIWLGEQSQTSEGGEIFPKETQCRYDTKGITLLPEQTDAGITGGETTCTWVYKAPPISTGLSVNSKPRARFYYTYKTSTIKTITLVPKYEMKALQDQGKTLPIEAYSTTKSPISIDIETASPIRTYGDEIGFPIVITVKNVGGGTVCLDKSDNCKKPGGVQSNSEWNRLKINIVLASDLELATGSCKKDGEEIVFTDKDPQTISCVIIAKNIDTQIGVIQKNIEVDADYGYFIDKTTDVTVYPSAAP